MPTDRKKDFPCLKCAEHVKKNDKAVMCALCDQWVHKTCEQMDDQTFAVLDRQFTHTGSAFWCCTSCDKFAKKFDKQVKELNREVQQVKGRVDNHDDDIKSLRDDVAKLTTDVTAAISQPKDQSSEATTKSVFKEINERDQRRHNVVVHGMPEAPPEITDGKERIARDIAKLEELIAVLDLDTEMEAETAISRTARLGAKTADKPRPLLVSFKEVSDQTKILAEVKKLSTMADDWKQISVVQDLTKIQREEERALKDEVNLLAAKLSDADAKNWEYKVVGKRGAKRVVKVPIKQVAQQPANQVRTRAGNK